jgi:UDP-N-acetylmuramoyl-tripeptide--D-alanyl-D-alanine ligase
MSVESTSDVQAGTLAMDVRDGFEVHQAALRRGMNVLLFPRQVMMATTADGEHELTFIHGIPQTSTLGAVTYAQDKRMRRALLERAGLPVPKGATFSVGRGVRDAKNFAERIGYPVVVKPAMGDNAIETFAGVSDEEQLDAAIDYLRTPPTERATFTRAAYALTELREPGEEDGRVVVPPGYRFLVEEHIRGDYVRFLVVRGLVRSVVHCFGLPGSASADGGRDILGEVHPTLLQLAIDAAQALPGLSVAAVDMVVADYRRPAAGQRVAVVELSERPGLVAQAGVSDELSQRLGDVILSMHADEENVAVGEPRDEVCVEIHAEAIPDLDGAIEALATAARGLGLTGRMEVTDRVEGVIDGILQGPAEGIAWLAEALLDGKLEGHRAMLVEARQRPLGEGHLAAAELADAGAQPTSSATSAGLEGFWTAELLDELLPGRWINHPGPQWQAGRAAFRRTGVQGPETLFIAIDEETWHRSTGNRGIYAGWKDTHELLERLGPNCVGAIVQRPVESALGDVPQFLVEDSYAAIPVLARYARERMRGKVIAITGTVGKSTVKDMLAHVLEGYGDVVATRGNENTRTGVALTVANSVTDPAFCVLEVAQSALWMQEGGICLLARPHIAVVTEIGLTQVGKVKSEEETARIKARVAEGIEPGGVAVLNRDMAHFDLVREEVQRYGATVVTYGFSADADIRVASCELDARGSDVEVVIDGETLPIRVPAPGRGMISNTLAAIGVIRTAGLAPADVLANLASFTLPPAKLQHLEYRLPGGTVTVLDDSYNAAPPAMRASIAIVGEIAAEGEARRIGVLGRMVDLGEQAEHLHRDLAQPLLASRFDLLFTHGDEMRYLREELPEHMLGPHFDDAGACAAAVAAAVRPGDLVLIKGSRRASDFGDVGKRLDALLG